MPSHKDERNMGVALTPCAVVGAGPLGLAGIYSRAWHDVYLAAATGEIAQLDAFLEDGGDRIRIEVGNVEGPLDFLGFLQRSTCGTHHLVIVKSIGFDDLVVEVESVLHLGL